jgi:UDP-N-acetylmuramyl-tripeptide synthetase
MEAYSDAKLRLFTELPNQAKKSFQAVMNGHDPATKCWTEKLLGEHGFTTYVQADKRSTRVVRPFWIEGDADLPFPIGPDFIAQAVEVRIDSLQFEVEMGAFIPLNSDKPPKGMEDVVCRAPLGGQYNLFNVAAACVMVRALGYDWHRIAQALPKVRPVPGRFEPVANDTGISILVDYAHTPDAIEKLLEAVRPLTSGRIITVFGCGGDRDRTKRPKMARAASERSDVTVVTSDNPRTEDPRAILNEVVTGIVPGRKSVAIIDRGEAIAHAISIASPGDVVVIAGKGHENYQIIGRTKYPMDDRELAREGLRRRGVVVSQ